MRRKLIAQLAIIAFVLVAAGGATLALTGRYSSSSSGDDVVTDLVAAPDRIDYEGGALRYVAKVETFARAIAAHEAEEAAKAEQARKAKEQAEKRKQAQRQTQQQQQSTQAPVRQYTSTPASGSVWDRLAQCESGGNWATNTGNGYSGGLQFAHASWTGFGGREFAPMAWQASREQQIVVAERILASQGWRAWPACSLKLGLR